MASAAKGKPRNVRQGSIVGPALVVLDKTSQPDSHPGSPSASRANNVASQEPQRRRAGSALSPELAQALYALTMLSIGDYDERHSVATPATTSASLTAYARHLFSDALEESVLQGTVPAARRSLSVRIELARGLKDKGMDGDGVLCDAMVMGVSDMHSAMASGGTRTEPEFRWDLVLPVTSLHDVLRVRLWTHPSSSKSKTHFLGQVDVRVDDMVVAGGSIDAALELQGRSNRSHVSGTVLVRASYVLEGNPRPTVPQGIDSHGLLDHLADMVLTHAAESASTAAGGTPPVAEKEKDAHARRKHQPHSKAPIAWDADIPPAARDLLRQFSRAHALTESHLRLSYLAGIKRRLARDHIVRLTGAAVVLSDCVRGTRESTQTELSQSTDELGNPTLLRIANFADENPPFLPLAAQASQPAPNSASSGASATNMAGLCLDMPSMAAAWRRCGVIEAQLVASRVFELQSMVAQLVSEYSLAFAPNPSSALVLSPKKARNAEHVIVLAESADAMGPLDPLDCLGFVLRVFGMAQELLAVAFASSSVPFSLADCVVLSKENAIRRIVATGEASETELAVVALNVADFIVEDLARDERYFAPVFARSGFDLLRTSARLLCDRHTELLRGLSKAPPVENMAVLSQLYARVKFIGDMYAKYVDGPQRLYPQVSAWLDPLVNAWFSNVISDTVRVWVCKAVADDDLRPVSARVLHSASAIDVVTCIFGCAEPLRKLDWPTDIAERTIPLGLANVTADQIRTYSSWLREQCLAAVAWGDAEARRNALARMCVALNNIAFAFEEMRPLCDLIGATSITTGSGAMMLTPGPSRVWGPKASAVSNASQNAQERGSGSSSGSSSQPHAKDPHRVVLSRSRQIAYYVRQQSAEAEAGTSVTAGVPSAGGAIAGVIIDALQTLNRTMDDIVGVLMSRMEPAVREYWRHALGVRPDKPSAEHAFEFAQLASARGGEASAANKGFRAVIERRFAPLVRNSPPASPRQAPADPLASSGGASYLASSLGKALKVLRWIDRPSPPQSPRALDKSGSSTPDSASAVLDTKTAKPADVLGPLLTFLGDSLSALADHLYEDVFLHALRDVWDVALRTVDAVLWGELAAPLAMALAQRPDSPAAVSASRKLRELTDAIEFLRRYFISGGNGITEEEAQSQRHASVLRTIDVLGQQTRELLRRYSETQADALAVRFAAGSSATAACFGLVEFRMGAKEIVPGQTNGPLRLSVNVTRVSRLFVGSGNKGRGVFVVSELLPPSNLALPDVDGAAQPQPFLVFQSLPYRRSPLIAFDDRRGSESPGPEGSVAVQFDEVFPFDIDSTWVSMRAQAEASTALLDCADASTQPPPPPSLPLLRIAVYCGRTTRDSQVAGAKAPPVELVGEAVIRVPPLDQVPVNVVREYALPLDPVAFGDSALLLRALAARKDVDPTSADFLRQREAFLASVSRLDKDGGGAAGYAANPIHTVLRKRFSKSSMSAAALSGGSAAS